MAANTILVVEDEAAIRQMLCFNLRRAGFEVVEAENCRQARLALDKARPRLMLVDWMLPDTSGLEFTRSLKRDPQFRSIPIIMLTARSQEQDKIAGLDGGADDYVTKPFSPRELVSRIKAIMRRDETLSDESGPVSLGPLTLDSVTHRITAGGQPVKLGPTEFRLLEHLMKNPERVYSRSHLLDRVWGNDAYLEERTVDVHISRVRKALEPTQCDAMIQTVRGSGYRISRQPD